MAVLEVHMRDTLRVVLYGLRYPEDEQMEIVGASRVRWLRVGRCDRRCRAHATVSPLG